MGRIVLNLPDEYHDRIVSVLREACAIHLVATPGPFRLVWADVREQFVRNATRNPTAEQQLTEQFAQVGDVRRLGSPVIDIADENDGGPFAVVVGPFDLLQVKIAAQTVSDALPDCELIADVRVGP